MFSCLLVIVYQDIQPGCLFPQVTDPTSYQDIITRSDCTQHIATLTLTIIMIVILEVIDVAVYVSIAGSS